MPTCFVIQPFDSGKFDKRYEDIFSPAIKAAGLEPYRVDKDPSVSVPIEAIEGGIRSATICLADITTNNPNVWYELGYAFATGRPVIIVCSEERTEKFPFDIQHRSIIQYLVGSSSDFDRLQKELTARLKARIDQSEVLSNIAKSDIVTPVEGLTQAEILVIAVISGSSFLPHTPVSVYSCKRDAEQAGITNMGFNLSVRRLITKKFVEFEKIYDEQNGEYYDGLCVTESGWSWIDTNDSLFVLHGSKQQKEFDDIPF